MELDWSIVYENERWLLDKKWTPCPKLLADPEHYTDSNYRKCSEPVLISLPHIEDPKYRWVWCQEWEVSSWRYAISFIHCWHDKMSPQHFVRQRVWKRARVRRIKEGITEVEEAVMENQRRIAHHWASPYFPGDPPHYSDESGRKKTPRDVDASLSADWKWKTEWEVFKNETTDDEGWQYSFADFIAEDFTPKYNIVLHFVRKRKWVRVRVYQGSEDTKSITKPVVMKRESVTKITLTNVESPPKEQALEEGWSDDDDEQNDEKKEQKGGNLKGTNFSQQVKNAPFKIEVCWDYFEACKMPLKQGQGPPKVHLREHGLSVWCPDVREQEESEADTLDTENDPKRDKRWYFLGHVMEEYLSHPKYSLPCLIVQNGTDSKAIVPPSNLEIIGSFKVSDPKSKADVLNYYCLMALPPDGYTAIGSVVVQLKDELEDLKKKDLLQYLLIHPTAKRLVERLGCIRSEYVHDEYKCISNMKMDDEKLYLLRQEPQQIAGVPKAVEMPIVFCRVDPPKGFVEKEITKENDERKKKLEFTKGIKQEFIEEANAARLSAITIVADVPLIVSGATVFDTSWTTRNLTESSNTKCSVWEPVLGKNEYMIGHLAISDWQHPCANPQTDKLIILKTGGSDPDAFKEPKGFMCVWSAHRPGWKASQSWGILSLSTSTQSEGNIPSGSFWRAVPPEGYVALGDIALGIDGHTGKQDALMLAASEVPKYVCVKREYASIIKKVIQPSKSDEQKHQTTSISVEESVKKNGEESLITRTRQEIWTSKSCRVLNMSGMIYSQPPFNKSISSPMMCCGTKPLEVETALPTLQVSSCVVEPEASVGIVKCGYLKKKGQEFVSQNKIRFCILTTQKKLLYYDGIDFKDSIQIDRMKEVVVTDRGNHQKFSLVLPERTYFFETDNKDADEWAFAIKNVQSKGNIGDLISPRTSEIRGPMTEFLQKKTEEEYILEFLKIFLEKGEKHLKKINEAITDVETDTSVYKAIQWYEELANWKAGIEILLSKWPVGSICPPDVSTVRLGVAGLMEEAENVILNDIISYAQDNITEITIVRLNSACLAMAELRKGQIRVSTHITDQLLRRARVAFTAGSTDASLSQIGKRFTEYRRIMSDYDAKYLSFIPLWWGLPTQIASLYTSLMGTQLDEQLTQRPEGHEAIVHAKEKARDFEKELMEDAMKRLTMIEIDVRSWGKGDPGDPYSWIRIDNKDKRLPGKGIGCVCVDIYNKSITQQKTFDTQGKQLEMNKEFADFLKSINEHWLLIMAVQDEIGTLSTSCQESLIKLGIAKEKIPKGTSSFVFIGRPSRLKSDPYFACVCYPAKAGPCNVRRVIQPFIASEDLPRKVNDTTSIPFYSGVLTQILDRHLEMYVGESAEAVQANLASVSQNETFAKLKAIEWLQLLHKSTEPSSAHLKSVVTISASITEGLQKTITITRGKPVIELVKKYVLILEDYGKVLVKLVTEAGGDALKQALTMSFDLASMTETKASSMEKNLPIFESKWNPNDLQYFIVYVCMIFNTCRKLKEMSQSWKNKAQDAVESRYKNAIDLKPLTLYFLSIEDQLVQILRATILSKWDPLLQFQHMKDWDGKKIESEINNRLDMWLGNCKKLLPRAVFLYFLKLFVAHFSNRFLRGLYFSRAFAPQMQPSSVVVAEFLPFFEQGILRQVSDASPTQVRILQANIKKSLVLPSIVVELGFASAGEKYQTQSVKTSVNPPSSSNTSSIFDRFFKASRQPLETGKLAEQLVQRKKTDISTTPFAKKAIEFYVNKDIKFNPLDFIQDYKNEFADLEDDDLNNDIKTDDDKKTVVEGGLSSLSFGLTLASAGIRKYGVIRQIMLMRGFDEMDQQTIQIVCEDAEQPKV